jgi:flagellin-specific chaperone FliS
MPAHLPASPPATPPSDSRTAWLEAQVTAAAPQKLRLKLLEDALRFACQTHDLWRASELETAHESLIRCRDIVSELIADCAPDELPPARQVAALYVFLLSALTEARETRDDLQLAGVIRVLQAEHEACRRLCEQLPERRVPPPSTAFSSREAFSIEA